MSVLQINDSQDYASEKYAHTNDFYSNKYGDFALAALDLSRSHPGVLLKILNCFTHDCIGVVLHFRCLQCRSVYSE